MYRVGFVQRLCGRKGVLAQHRKCVGVEILVGVVERDHHRLARRARMVERLERVVEVDDGIVMVVEERHVLTKNLARRFGAVIRMDIGRLVIRGYLLWYMRMGIPRFRFHPRKG